MRKHKKINWKKWGRNPIIVLAVLSIIVGTTVGCMMSMPGKSFKGAAPALDAEQKATRERLRQHIDALAVDIGERNIYDYEKLEQAEKYIRSEFEKLGYEVDAQEYPVNDTLVRNLEVSLPAADDNADAEIIVIGAHYDSVPGSPAANDNASGVAALLELARHFKTRPPRPARLAIRRVRQRRAPLLPDRNHGKRCGS